MNVFSSSTQKRQYGQPANETADSIANQVVDIKPSVWQQILHKLSEDANHNSQ